MYFLQVKNDIMTVYQSTTFSMMGKNKNSSLWPSRGVHHVLLDSCQDIYLLGQGGATVGEHLPIGGEVEQQPEQQDKIQHLRLDAVSGDLGEDQQERLSCCHPYGQQDEEDLPLSLDKVILAVGHGQALYQTRLFIRTALTGQAGA